MVVALRARIEEDIPIGTGEPRGGKPAREIACRASRVSRVATLRVRAPRRLAAGAAARTAPRGRGGVGEARACPPPLDESSTSSATRRRTRREGADLPLICDAGRFGMLARTHARIEGELLKPRRSAGRRSESSCRGTDPGYVPPGARGDIRTSSGRLKNLRGKVPPMANLPRNSIVMRTTTPTSPPR